MLPRAPPERRLRHVALHLLGRSSSRATPHPAATASAIVAVSALPISPEARRLTPPEQDSFVERGFVHGLPVFQPSASASLVAKYSEITSRLAALPQPLTTHDCFWFFKSSRWVYELTMVSQIHDYVEGLLGPDFFLWGGAFFAKQPGDGTVVPFHQDAQ